MNKITFITALLLFVAQLTYSQNQEKISRIKVTSTDEATTHIMATQGIDLSCGVAHDHDGLTLELADAEIDVLRNNNIQYEVLIDDLTAFYLERSRKEKPLRNKRHKTKAKETNNQSQERASVSSIIQDNIIQYTGSSEINWVEPDNFHLGTTMGNCLTISQVVTELGLMDDYDVAEGKNIVSTIQDASSTGQTTWGNPATEITNNGLTYSGQGTGSLSKWDPQTIHYIRITGNESTTAEGTKPQILYTSMIHSREVSALMNNIYFMWYLIENYGTDPGVTELVDNNELYFVPVVNPDGLRWNEHLSPGGNGSQRKNCRPNTGSTSSSTVLRGVDLNRNFDYLWGLDSGSSGDPTSNTYRGPSRASEPETQIMVDFITNRNFKTSVWNHSYANSVPHPYGGVPGMVSNREDEFYRWHEEMTRYNRYLYGATIFYPSSGLPDDWMAGSYDDGINPPTPDFNGSIGSGQGILGTTPEHGSSSGGFWPSDTAVYQNAENSMRISFATAYYAGKYAKLHDLTQSNITGTSDVNLDFGIERIGQTQSGFTVTVTPISSNILSIASPSTESGIPINTTDNPSFRNQRNVTATMQLDPTISDNEKIEYNVKLSNDNGIIYEANYEKYYNPTVLFDHNPDVNGLSGWTNNGWSNTSSDAYSGSNSLSTGSYNGTSTRTLTTTSGYDLSGSNEVLIQFYAKWDLERNYDYVEILGSTNGSTWQTLIGDYMKPEATSSTTNHDNKASATQQSNSGGQIYDGDRMDNWVKEEILIDGSNNSFLVGATNAQIRFNFKSDGSNVSENYTTTSDGYFIDDFKIISVQIPCVELVPTGLNVSSVGATSATIGWDVIPSATYDLRYGVTGSGTWTDVLDITTASHNLTGLTASTDYDVEVRSKCDDSNMSAYTTAIYFTTTADDYCASEGNNAGATDEWIGNVALNSINNSTGDDHYSDFTTISTVLTQNEQYSITITPTWNGATYDEAYSVWIDYNRDGDFTDIGEQVWSQIPTQTSPVSGNFTIPSNIEFGSTRMRVSMQYNAIPTSCQSFQYGEVEDYSVYLSYDGLMYANSTWTPNGPSGITGSLNALVLNGNSTIATDVAINDIEINPNGSMTISKTGSLTVNGDLTVNNNLVLESDSNEYSSLIVSGSVIGDVAYKRHVNTNAGGNDLIAPPVSGQVVSDFISANSNIMSNGTNTLFLFGPFDKPSGTYSLYSNTESSSLAAGMGYRAASTDDGTFTFSGAVNTGDINVAIPNSGVQYLEWNLVGNPYPSYIGLSEFLLGNNSQFDTQKTGIYGYDGTASDGWTIWNQAYADANPNTLITPGQGFYVASKPGGGLVTFTPNMRATGTSDDFILGRSSNTISYLKIKLEEGEQLYNTDFYFTDNATLGLDPGYDAGMFGNSSTEDFSIYSHLVEENTGINMAIQAVGNTDLSNNLIIPIGINANQGQQLTVSIVETTLDSNVDVYFEDNVTSAITLLNTNNHTFTASTDLLGTGRFFLRFESSTLSTLDNEVDSLQIFNTISPKALYVNGLLTETTQLYIYDVQGRKILDKELDENANSQKINISNLEVGIYIVEIKNNNQTRTKKIIVK